MKNFFRSLPFTWGMALILLAVAVWTKTHADKLSTRWLNRVGFAPYDLWFWRWERLFTSALVTSGGQLFWPVLSIATVALGLTEWLAGTKRAIATFWGVHLVTLLTESLLIALPLHSLGCAGGTALTLARDVGPSAGYFGCFGLVSRRLPDVVRQLTGGFIFGALLVNLFIPAANAEEGSAKVFADLAHLIAFPLGWFSVNVKC
jgi:hypothetical protein